MSLMNMTVNGFEEHLRMLDPTLKVWFNTKSGFWQIYKNIFRVYRMQLEPGVTLTYRSPHPEKDLVASLMDGNLKALPLDLRAIWKLRVGDARSDDFETWEWKEKYNCLTDENGDVVEEPYEIKQYLPVGEK